MPAKFSVATGNAALNSTGFKEQFSDGKLYIFTGAVPLTADEALDMATTHTLLSVISDASGAGGLDFGTPAGGVLGKDGSQVWSGLNTFDGFEDAETTLTPTFFRLCKSGDNGQGGADSSTGYRIQGTVGGPGSGATLVLGSADMTAGNTQTIGDGEIVIDLG